MDLEAIACQNQASGAQSGGTPRLTPKSSA
jgi:hypothetical protein